MSDDKQVIERVWKAPIELVWELWSTPAGLSSWWGPKGFDVEVHEMDLRVGGAFRYTMRAANEATAAMMKERGKPANFSVDATYTAVEPPNKLAYDSPFGSDKLMMSVAFTEVAEGVQMVLVIDSTMQGAAPGAAMGWRSALEGFEERLAAAL